MFYNYLMANKTKYEPSSLRGLSIHQTGKKTVYAPFYSDKGYIINTGNIRHYINYVVGYLVSLVAFEIAVIITKNTPVSILAALAVLVINFLSFYFNFLKKASVIENFAKEKKENFIDRQAKMLEYDRIYTLIICCILLVVIFVFYAMWQHLEGVYFWIVVLCTAASVIYGILNLIILIRKRKMDEK